MLYSCGPSVAERESDDDVHMRRWDEVLIDLQLECVALMYERMERGAGVVNHRALAGERTTILPEPFEQVVARLIVEIDVIVRRGRAERR